MMTTEASGPILVAGATGFVGRRLVSTLLAQGIHVRGLSRNARRFAGSPHVRHPGFDPVEADVLDPASLDGALDGCSAVYYLVHSMTGGNEDFAERDLQAARNLGDAAAAAGVTRIIYLGGLGDDDDPRLSEHLRSRHATGQALREGGVPVTELRAGIVVGAGSASFDLIAALGRLPVVVAPASVNARCEPIAVDDVVRYLAAALTEPRSVDQVLEIGNGEPLRYRQMIEICGELMGRTPWIVTAPNVSAALASYWLSVAAQVDMSLTHPLVQGMESGDLVVRDTRAQEWFGEALLTFREGAMLALAEGGRPRLARVPRPADVRRLLQPLPGLGLKVASEVTDAINDALREPAPVAWGDAPKPRASRHRGRRRHAAGYRPPLLGVHDGPAAPRTGQTAAWLDERVTELVQDAYEMERNVETMLTSVIDTTDDQQIAAALREHREETQQHQQLLRQRLTELGASPAARKRAAARTFAAVKGSYNYARSDKAMRNVRDLHQVEHAEIAAYELLRRVATAAGDTLTADIAAFVLEDEQRMARRIDEWWDRAVELGIAAHANGVAEAEARSAEVPDVDLVDEQEEHAPAPGSFGGGWHAGRRSWHEPG